MNSSNNTDIINLPLTERERVSQAEQFATFVDDLKEKKRMPDLKLITGGGTASGNWLLDLAEDTVFLVADKLERQNFMALRLELQRKDPQGAFCVLWAYPSDETDINSVGRPFGTVIPQRFVNRFDLIKVISEPSDIKQE